MYKEIRFDVLAKIHSKRVLSNEKTYLLRNQPDKAKAWEDLLFARRVIKGK